MKNANNGAQNSHSLALYICRNVRQSLQKFVLAVMLHKTIKYLDKGTFIKKNFL